MKDAIFILLVACVLMGLTAIRYRRQITGMIGFARMLKDAKKSMAQMPISRSNEPAKTTPLVNCSKCGVWVPQNKARKVGDAYLCSDHA